MNVFCFWVNELSDNDVVDIVTKKLLHKLKKKVCNNIFSSNLVDVFHIL